MATWGGLFDDIKNGVGTAAKWWWNGTKKIYSDPALLAQALLFAPIGSVPTLIQANKELEQEHEDSDKLGKPFGLTGEEYEFWYNKAKEKYGEEATNKAIAKGISPKDFAIPFMDPGYTGIQELDREYKNEELDPYGRPAYARPDYGAGLDSENIETLMDMYEEQDQAAAEENARREYLMNLVNSFAPPKRDFNITPQLSNLKLYEGKFGK